MIEAGRVREIARAIEGGNGIGKKERKTENIVVERRIGQTERKSVPINLYDRVN